MSTQRVIMNFIAPSYDDIETIAQTILNNLPDDLDTLIGDISLIIDDLIDENKEEELDLDDPFDCPVLFQPEKQIAPGVERTNGDNDGMLYIYRRPVLDEWCNENETLTSVLRTMIIEEFGRVFDLSDDDIEEMCEDHD